MLGDASRSRLGGGGADHQGAVFGQTGGGGSADTATGAGD